MNKVHDEIEALTDIYLAGGLGDDERSEIENHAAACKTCAAVLRDAKEFHGWVRGTTVATAPPDGLEDRIISSLRNYAVRRFPKGIRALIGVAAALLLVVVGGVFTASDEGAALMARVAPEEQRHHYQSTMLNPDHIEQTHRGAVNMNREPLNKLSTLSKGVESEGYKSAPKPGSEALKNEVEKATRGDAERRLADAGAPEESAESGGAWADKKAGEAFRKSQEQQGQRPEAPRQPDIDDRKIIRNADLHLEVDKYDDAYKAIAEITRSKRGFIAGASTTKLANGKIRATVTLRIPPEKFEETLAELGRLGTERHRNISTADVTKQYSDLESRLRSKETLVERLKKVLLEGKGTVKELMEVEVQMGATIEAIEQIKGELKYYDNLVGMSTITMQVFERDLGLPFEYVQTLQANIAVTADNADAVYVGAQDVILKAGGQVAESRMTRANEDSSSGYVKGKVDAEKFPAVREALKNLGQQVDKDTVNQQQTGRGGQGDPNPDAKIKKEQAVIDFQVDTPPVKVTRTASIVVEASPAETAYHEARKSVTDAKGKILGGSFTDRKDGATAYVRGQVVEGDFSALVEKLKSLGKVKNATVNQEEPGSDTGRTPKLRRKGEVLIEIVSPPPLIPEESGIGKVIRETFTRSIAGLLWSFEKLFVGIALAGPWIVLALIVLLIWRRARRKPVQTSS